MVPDGLQVPMYAGGGVGGVWTPAIYLTIGLIPDPKGAFNSSGHEFSDYTAKFCLKVTDGKVGPYHQSPDRVERR